MKERLFNRNFFCVSISALCMFFAFFLLMPIVAKYLIEEFNASSSLAGVVVSSYIITSVLARPFSGYLVDTFDRRKFYLITFSIFATLFIGYIIADSVSAIVVTRVLLGATFSFVTTAASTLAIDTIPSNRRAEGIGYYGAITFLAMAIGPMTGLYLIEAFDYQGLFIFAVASCFVGVVIASFIRTKPRARQEREALSFDRFFLKSGTSIALVVALFYVFYGTLMTYMPLYISEVGLTVNSGNFFLALSIGVIISRSLSGRFLYKGLYNLLLMLGGTIVVISTIIFIFFITNITFAIASFGIGIGFGLVVPSVQTMIVNLVAHNRRGTANSTYLIALDTGSGLGMLVGGTIANIFNYKIMYCFGLGFVILAMLIYRFYSRSNYNKHLNNAKLSSHS